MAVGTVTSGGFQRTVKILEDAAAVNGVPTSVNDGVAITQDVLAGGAPSNAMLILASSAGAGTMSCSAKLWNYSLAAGLWVPYGAHATAASRGLINLANSIDEQQSDKLRHAEAVTNLWAFDRVYLEIAAIGGNAAAKAELDLGTPSADLDTVVRAKSTGTAGNSITVQAVADSAPAAGVTISETDTAVTIHYEVDVSTVAHVETAIGSGSTLIEVKTAGTGATVLGSNDAFAATPLAGGVTMTTLNAWLVLPTQA